MLNIRQVCVVIIKKIRQLYLFIAAFFILVSIVSCGDSGKSPQETYTYHVWLEHQNGKKIYAGTVTGLSSCKYIANQKIGGSKNPGWSYFCCWENNGNKCSERHK